MNLPHGVREVSLNDIGRWVRWMNHVLTVISYFLAMCCNIIMWLLVSSANFKDGAISLRECITARTWQQYLTRSPWASYQTAATPAPWCMLGSLTHGGGENVPGILGAHITCNFTYLVVDPWPSLLIFKGNYPWNYCKQILTMRFVPSLSHKFTYNGRLPQLYFNYHICQ